MVQRHVRLAGLNDTDLFLLIRYVFLDLWYFFVLVCPDIHLGCQLSTCLAHPPTGERGVHHPARRPNLCDSGLHLNRPPPNLVALQAFKQRLEVALTKAFVGLALDELKEDGAEQSLAEDLQQQTLFAVGG